MEFSGSNGTALMQRWVAEEFAYISHKRDLGISDLQEEREIRQSLQLPEFEFGGRECNKWIWDMEDVFHFFQLNEETKLKAAIIGLHGDALYWFEEEHQRRPFSGWQDLKITMVRCFDSSPLTPWMGQPTPVGPDIFADGGSKSGGSIEGLGYASSSFDGGDYVDNKMEQRVDLEIINKEDCEKARSRGRCGGFDLQRWWKPEEVHERQREEVQELKKNHDVGGQDGWLDSYFGLGVGTGCGSGGGPGNLSRKWWQKVRKRGLNGMADEGRYWGADLVGGSQGDFVVGYIDGKGTIEGRQDGGHGEFFEQDGSCGSGSGGGSGVSGGWEGTMKKGEISGGRGALACGCTGRGGFTVDGDLSCSERCLGTFQKIQDREVEREEYRGSLEEKPKQYNKGKIVKDFEDESPNNSNAIWKQGTWEEEQNVIS